MKGFQTSGLPPQPPSQCHCHCPRLSRESLKDRSWLGAPLPRPLQAPTSPCKPTLPCPLAHTASCLVAAGCALGAVGPLFKSKCLPIPVVLLCISWHLALSSTWLPLLGSPLHTHTPMARPCRFAVSRSVVCLHTPWVEVHGQGRNEQTQTLGSRAAEKQFCGVQACCCLVWT